MFTNGFTINDVNIVTNTGDILLQDFVSDDVKIMSDTGNIVIKSGSGNPMEIDSETGNVYLEISHLFIIKSTLLRAVSH